MIATGKSSAAIHPLLKQLHVFEETINVLPPNKEARKEVSRTAVSSKFAYLSLFLHRYCLTSWNSGH